MAAPMVAGAAALLLGAEPGLTPAQVVRRLERSSTALCGGARQRQLDVAALLGQPLPPPATCR
jgi:hypothetical protein